MSAIAILHEDQQDIIVSARLFLYGSEASEEIGQAIVDEITTMWNEPKATLNLNGKDFLIRFDIAFALISYSDLLVLCPQNRDFRNNFIRIESSNRMARSMMGFGLGDNSGHWLSTDNLGTSTTAAHEFGHALGLPHPGNLDYRGTGFPPLMAPRGTLVDAEYQWNPAAIAGEYGGTMKPIHRKVSFAEIAAVFENHPFNKGISFQIGRLTNIIFDQVANPLRIV